MINNNINKNSLRGLERETVTRGKTAREKRQKMTNGCTKETVSPVSKKQELSPSEQSLWNKDSLQTFVHNQSKSTQRLNCLDYPRGNCSLCPILKLLFWFSKICKYELALMLRSDPVLKSQDKWLRTELALSPINIF